MYTLMEIILHLGQFCNLIHDPITASNAFRVVVKLAEGVKTVEGDGSIYTPYELSL